MFHEEILFLKANFQKNPYPIPVINRSLAVCYDEATKEAKDGSSVFG